MTVPIYKLGSSCQLQHAPTRRLGDYIDRVTREELVADINSICDDLAVCARNAASAGDDGSARRIQAQVIRIRALETRL